MVRKFKMGKKTLISWVFFVSALSIIMIGVGILPGLVQSWNDVVTGGSNDWEVLGSDDFNVTTSNSSRTSIHYTHEDDGVPYYEDQKSNVLWNDSEDGKSSIFVSPDYATFISFTGGYQSVIFITNWKISDLIDQDLYGWRLVLNGSREVEVSLFVSGAGPNGYNDEQGSLWTDSSILSMDREFNLEVLDLMYFKTLNGNGYLCFRITIRSSNGQDPFDIAERFDFQFMRDREENPIASVNPFTAWKILAGIEGIVFVLMGLGASPWWNPTDRYNPGPVDKFLAKRVFKRKKSGRRY